MDRARAASKQTPPMDAGTGMAARGGSGRCPPSAPSSLSWTCSTRTRCAERRLHQLLELMRCMMGSVVASWVRR